MKTAKRLLLFTGLRYTSPAIVVSLVLAVSQTAFARDGGLYGDEDVSYADLHRGQEQSSQATGQAHSGHGDEEFGSVFHRVYHRRGEYAAGALWSLYNPLETVGITLESVLTVDWSKNLGGGLNTKGSALRHLFQVAMTIDVEQLFHWNGGTAFLLFQNQNGPDASAQDVGDFQAFSNVDADGRTQVAELWVQQVLSNGGIRIKFGKFDVNSEFAYVDNGGSGGSFFAAFHPWSGPKLGFRKTGR